MARRRCCGSARCTPPNRCNPGARRQARQANPAGTEPRRASGQSVVGAVRTAERRHAGAQCEQDRQQAADAGAANRTAQTGRQGLRDRLTAPAPRPTRPWSGSRPRPARRRSRSSPARPRSTRSPIRPDRLQPGRTEKYLLGPTLIEGNQLTTATAGIPQNNVSWVVDLEFNADGAVAFENATRALSAKSEPQNRFAIVLDGESISAPSVSEAIPGGRAQITGNFNQKTATELANVLKYGALPLAFDVSEVSNVSATLGGEQLRAGIIAGIIGLVLVVAVLLPVLPRPRHRGGLPHWRSPPIITYCSMVLLGSSVGFALNLPGIAGAIVAIGITADSFVIYFERIRDEVRDGRSLRTAVETGWRRARQTILIADAVSMLSALMLFILAIGSVKGFAFTLGLTTLIDVMVVFIFTKPLMTLLARTKFFGGGHKWSGLDPEHLGVKALPGQRSRRPRSASEQLRGSEGL